MRSLFALTTLVVAGMLPAISLAQDAQSILQTMQQKQLHRWDGVNDYVVNQSMMGHATEMYFQRTEVTDHDGKVQTLFLPISASQRASGSCTNSPLQMTPEALETYASGAEAFGAGMGEEIETGLEKAGLPRGLLAASGSTPMATFDPRVMMGSGATFARAAAEAQRRQAGETSRNQASARESADHMMQFMKTAKFVGHEQVDGRKAYHLSSDKIHQVTEDGGRKYTMDAMSLWIDARDYVPLRMKIEGTLTSGGETRRMAIEVFQTDYRNVPGSKMYESYKQVMKISGMLDAAQEAEMHQATAKMADFEKKMANMPASQRKMLENMMGPQLEMMRTMASGGGFHSETIVRSIRVNPGAVAEDGSPCPAAPTKPIRAAGVDRS